LKLQTPEGRRMRNVETIRWKNGDMQIVALFRHEGEDGTAELVLPQTVHVFDLRARKTLGRTQRFPVEVLSQRATFYALYPGDLPETEVRVTPAAVTRGEVARGTIRVPQAAGLHAFRISVASSAGPQEWHDQIVLAGDERVGFDLPVAWNDPSGPLQVSAVDLFTDAPTEAQFRVR
jgi:hypothetical protein